MGRVELEENFLLMFFGRLNLIIGHANRIAGA
jgi:hypothetical protein